ncbi:glycine receptor subunit alpha-3 [Caerostris darwini]|uniref:Glycine receptor subunit alpha-3 n=1 Tax=Caerostris darwini TaxID=1538125 RepID=A0AAV4NVY6_9ARAC|nr:glycine receptor subunit alpha-3 [Caerostris darwini]
MVVNIKYGCTFSLLIQMITLFKILRSEILDFETILPPNPQDYDNLQPPKEKGDATVVRFHVTVLSLDTIDEGSMIVFPKGNDSPKRKEKDPQRRRFSLWRLSTPHRQTNCSLGGSFWLSPIGNAYCKHIEKIEKDDWFDLRGGYLHVAELERLPATLARKYDDEVPTASHKLAQKNVEAGFLLQKCKASHFQEMTIPNHYIWLYSDKTILYMVKLTLLLSCSMKFESYPHDTQICMMKIESLSYTTDDLLFDWEQEVPLVVDDSIELPQHNLVDTSLGDCTKVYSTGNFTCIEVIFTLKRRLGYYMFHTYIPTCLIVIMSWISFWIKPEAVPARVTLCVTSLLTLSTQHAQSQKALPPVSYIKAIDIFMSSCTVFVFASLMEYAMVNILLGEGLDEMLDEDGNRRPQKQTASLAKTAPSIMMVSTLQDGISPLPNGTRPKITSTLYLRSRHRRRAILVDKFSRVIFPLSFVILNTAYWSFYLESF